jgi:integrase
MPGHETALYRRGKYWLGWDRKKDGSLRSPFLAVFWYDPDARRVRSRSTGSAEEGDAILTLDRIYLADADEAPAFCQACGQPIAQAEAYLLADAIADYRLEHGDSRASADSIEARLNHVLDFLEAETARGDDGQFGIETSCAAACTRAFATAFRAWSRAQPVTWKNKAGEITVSRPRAPATTEESLVQVIAALNHAVAADPPRSDKRPTYKPTPRKQVSRPRRTRITVATIADMVAYAAEPNKQRGSLHAFLVGTLCTIARPDAVVDIGIAPDRQQWWPGSPTIDLNPHGREQTKKFRPVLPVLPLLATWLNDELARYLKLPDEERIGRGWLVNYFGRPVLDVDRAWSTMLVKLKLPTGREWKSYVLRHSLATIVRNRGAEKWDLEGYMGHRAPSQTEVYAIGEFRSVERALTSVLEEIEQLVPGALHRSGTGAGLPVIQPEEAKMTG